MANNLSGLLVTKLSSCHTLILFLQRVMKDVQSKSFPRQMMWSLLHEGCPILIVRTDVVFIFLYYLPALVICCSCILQSRFVFEAEDRAIYLEEWWSSPCQCFLCWVALLILNRNPPCILKLTQRAMHVKYIANLVTGREYCWQQE